MEGQQGQGPGIRRDHQVKQSLSISKPDQLFLQIYIQFEDKAQRIIYQCCFKHLRLKFELTMCIFFNISYRKQVLATKAEAERDGVKVPTTLAEYCVRTRAPPPDEGSDLFYDYYYDDDDVEDGDGDCCYDEDDSGNEES